MNCVIWGYLVCIYIYKYVCFWILPAHGGRQQNGCLCWRAVSRMSRLRRRPHWAGSVSLCVSLLPERRFSWLVKRLRGPRADSASSRLWTSSDCFNNTVKIRHLDYEKEDFITAPRQLRNNHRSSFGLHESFSCLLNVWMRTISCIWLLQYPLF